MQRFFAVIVSTLVLSLATPFAVAADLIETASTSGNLKTFVAVARAAGLTETLKNSGPYTVFAPTNAAFEKLPKDTLDALMSDKAKLAQVLAHHVIPGKVLVAGIKPGKVKTVQGDTLTLTSDNGKVTVGNANVIQSDLMADNGIIHEIDTVVLPE